MITHITADAFHPLKENVFVDELDRGVHLTHGGIIIPDDNMTDRGIHPRWARVWAIGPDVQGIEVGEWLLIEHGRWTTGIDMRLPSGLVRVWRIEWPKAVILASDTDPRANFSVSMPKRR